VPTQRRKNENESQAKIAGKNGKKKRRPCSVISLTKERRNESGVKKKVPRGSVDRVLCSPQQGESAVSFEVRQGGGEGGVWGPLSRKDKEENSHEELTAAENPT